MHESVHDGVMAHVCIYLPEGEVHLDMEQEDIAASVEALAQETAESVYNLILHFYQELSNANASRSQIQ